MDDINETLSHMHLCVQKNKFSNKIQDLIKD